ncbi:aminotransferase class V-fold PLP-dependent enzyme [Candidatus Bipolaricaulota bacterium]
MSEALKIHTVRTQIVGADTRVQVLDGSLPMYVNFDNASSTPALRPALDAITKILPWYGSVGRGAGFKSYLSTSMFEEARQLVGEFVGANSDSHVVIFAKNTTEAINKLAHRFHFSEGDIVLASLMEHHSNDLPWRSAADVRHIAVDSIGALDMDHLKHLLAELAPRVRLVAITGASNVTGHINPVHEIAELAHEAGAQVLVDAAQLAPHRSISIGEPDDPSHIDYLAYTAHKMYAPFGIGALVADRETFLEGDPDCVGGGTVDLVTTDAAHWAELPQREEAGTPNVIGAIAWAAAIAALQEIGMEQIAAHEAQLTAYFLARLESIEGATVYGASDPVSASNRLGVVPIGVDGVHHHLVAAILGYEGGIGVRSGLFCAHPYLIELLGISPQQVALQRKEIETGRQGLLPGLTRISFGVYNDETEIDRLTDTLDRIVRGQQQGNYEQDHTSGAFSPQGFSYADFRYSHTQNGIPSPRPSSLKRQV